MRFVSVYYHPFLCCLVGIACRRVTGAQITAPFIIICVSSSRFCIRFVRGLRRVRYLFLALYVILFLWLISFVLLSFLFFILISLCLIAETATLAEWNVAVYGTKDSPESKNRAAVPPPSTAAPGTTTLVQSQPKMMVDQTAMPQSVQPASADWSSGDRKATIHQNNVVDQDRTPFLPNGGQLLEPVPVLSSSSSNGGAGCRPDHWNSAAAICLSTCLVLVIATLLVSDDHLVRWTRLSR